MRLPTVIVLAAAVAGIGASSPAFAITFADYSATGDFPNISWVSNGTSGTLSGSGSVDFSFLTPSLSSLTGLSATFDYTGTSSDAAVSAAGYDIQPGLKGKFSYVYNGATPFTLDGKSYSAGTVLLSGHFSGADIVGQDGSSAGNVNDATLTGGKIFYSSPFLKFGNGQRSYSVEMTSIQNPLGIGSGGQLNSFGAVSTGSFEAEIKSGGRGVIPEPGTWALMMIGVGAVGAAMRRKAALTAI